MGMVKVYRVEGSTGLGPYQDLYEGEVWDSPHNEYNGHPAWSDEIRGFSQFGNDVSRYYHDHYHAGFESMKQLFKWFGGYLRRFIKTSDLRIKVFEVPEEHVIKLRSGTQLVFIKPGNPVPETQPPGIGDDEITDVEFEELPW